MRLTNTHLTLKILLWGHTLFGHCKESQAADSSRATTPLPTPKSYAPEKTSCPASLSVSISSTYPVREVPFLTIYRRRHSKTRWHRLSFLRPSSGPQAQLSKLISRPRLPNPSRHGKIIYAGWTWPASTLKTFWKIRRAMAKLLVEIYPI
jgi:hypothetical protein